MGLPPLIRARDAVRPTPVEDPNPIPQSGPCVHRVHFASRRAPAARRAELTFTSHALFAQAIDAFVGRVLPRQSMVVNEMTGLRSTAAAGAQGGAGVQLLGSRPFPRHTSALVPREGANGERRQLAERARWARE